MPMEMWISFQSNFASFQAILKKLKSDVLTYSQKYTLNLGHLSDPLMNDYKNILHSNKNSFI